VPEQAEDVGQEAVTTQAVGAETVLELLDAVLTLAAIVVESEGLRGPTGAVGNQEAQVGSDGGVFGPVADATPARPTAGAMAEAGKAARWELCTTIAPLQLFLPRLGALLEDAVSGDAEGVLQAEELEDSYRSGRAKPASPRSLIGASGKADCKRGTRRSSMGTDAGMAGGVSRAQPHRQQASGVALEDQHGVIHVLATAAVEEAELLLAVGVIISGIEIEQDLTAGEPVVAKGVELLAPSVVQAHQIAS
jgi:hypothetical protein